MRRIVAMILLLVGAGACRPFGEGNEERQPHVILITLDTLRADFLGCYGSARPTPALDRFSEQATLYSDAVATAPWTLPSHASLLTGLFPFEHGAVTKLDPEERKEEDDVYPLAPGFQTLAERLRAEGYRTAAILANSVYLTERYGLDQGFDTYSVEWGTAEEVNRRVIGWLDQLEPAQPMFLFINYMDVHGPYNTRPRAEFPGVPSYSRRLAERVRQAVHDLSEPFPAEEIEVLASQYELAVANLDEGLGTLFATLRSRELFEDSMVIITSDHGEYFGEHRLFEHSKDVYEAALRVPLLIKAPGQTEGSRETRPISLAHVPAIVASETAVLDPGVFPWGWPGDFVSAENHLTRRRELREPYGARFQRSRRVVRDGRFKYIHSSDGNHELYDLAADPEEGTNLLDERSDVAQRLGRLLDRTVAEGVQRWSEFAGDPSDVALTPEEEANMRALGYL